jgi:hypothetical protein
MGEDDLVRIVETARLLTRHRQHRQYRPGNQAEGPLRTSRQACADDADGADAKAALFGGLFRLADAENTIDRWKPFSSLAAPASSAAIPAKRSLRTASYRSHLTTYREGHADFVR